MPGAGSGKSGNRPPQPGDREPNREDARDALDGAFVADDEQLARVDALLRQHVGDAIRQPSPECRYRTTHILRRVQEQRQARAHSHRRVLALSGVFAAVAAVLLFAFVLSNPQQRTAPQPIPRHGTIRVHTIALPAAHPKHISNPINAIESQMTDLVSGLRGMGGRLTSHLPRGPRKPKNTPHHSAVPNAG